jgi:plasmid stability protein
LTVRKHFTARIPDTLTTALAQQAEANHRSANAELTSILRNALSGTPSTPVDLDQARVIARMVAPDLAPYKAALQRLIDDSAALREKYEDLDAAVEQARGLL